MPRRPAPAPLPAFEPLRTLGDVPVRDFMRRYWQRRPLLVRGLFGPREFAGIDRPTLLALAARDDVESRLVRHVRGRWTVAHGPHAAGAMPSPRTRAWTLLVQGVEGHVAEAARLLGRFRFVPDARLDDLMVSYAAPDGGVGPHVDSYDVFLVQTSGRRRWRISRQRDLAIRAGLPLKILAGFRPAQEWVLQPGDALYLPPGVAHEGVALDDDADCLTCSVGFRAPAWRELIDRSVEAAVDELADALARSARFDGRYADPGAPVATEPARLPDTMVAVFRRRFAALRLSHAAATRVLLAHLSEPKSQVVFDRATRPLAVARFVEKVRARGITNDLRTRLLYGGGWLGINGDVLPMPAKSSVGLKRLGDRRRLSPVEASALLRAGGAAAGALLHEWYVAGWIHLPK